ncbi:MAG: hypothetical protein RLZZ292_4077 [Bacteroidota bacterium]|jgi:hypothetical protein
MNTFWNITQQLSLPELQTLQNYISVASIRQENIAKLTGYVMDCRKKKQKMDKANAFVFLYQEAYDVQKHDSRMRQLLFVAGQVAEEYLAFEKFKTQKATQQGYLAQVYQELRMETALKEVLEGKISKKTKSTPTAAIVYPILEAEVTRSATYFYQNYELHRAYHDFYQRVRPMPEDLRLEQGVVALTYSYLIAMLRQGVRMLSHQGSRNAPYSLAFLTPILVQIETEQLCEKSIAIQAHYSAYKMLVDTNIGIPYYQTLRHLLNEQKHLFELDELDDFYTISINFCNRLIPQNREFFILQCYELYEQRIANNALQATESNLKNFTTLGNYLKKYDNTLSFLQQQKEKLPDAFYYNTARVYFTQKNYLAFRKNLQKIEYRNIFFRNAANNNDMRSMEIVVFYEEKEDQLLEYALTNFYNSLRQQKEMTEQYRKQYFLFISIVKQLYNYDGKIPSSKKAKLVEKVNNNPVAEKNWLLSKF